MALKQTSSNHISIASCWQKIATGAKTGTEIAGALKSVHEICKDLYTARRVLAPGIGQSSNK